MAFTIPETNRDTSSAAKRAVAAISPWSKHRVELEEEEEDAVADLENKSIVANGSSPFDSALLKKKFTKQAEAAPSTLVQTAKSSAVTSAVTSSPVGSELLRRKHANQTTQRISRLVTAMEEEKAVEKEVKRVKFELDLEEVRPRHYERRPWLMRN